MRVSDVRPSKGTVHLVSKEDFCRIVNFQEPDDIENPRGHYEVEYQVAKVEGQDKTVTRSFACLTEGAQALATLLGTCAGAVLVRGPEFIADANADMKKVVNVSGRIVDLAKKAAQI